MSVHSIGSSNIPSSWHHVGQARFAGLMPVSPFTKFVLKSTVATGGLYTLAMVSKPFVLHWRYYRPRNKPTETQPPAQKAFWDQQRRQYFENTILNNVVRPGNGRINWYQLASIVEFVARNTHSDEDFRNDLWFLFGWQKKGVRGPLVQYLDPKNTGLKKPYHNSSYQEEQAHHYLGGACGNTGFIPSHLMNNRLYAYLYELKEVFKIGKYNMGDVRLFLVSRTHRDKFLKEGRMAFVSQIRSLLEPRYTRPPVFRDPERTGLKDVMA